MPITNRLTPVLHKREWQMMNPLGAATVGPTSSSYFITDQKGQSDDALYFYAGSSNTYLYSFANDMYHLLPTASMSDNAAGHGYRSPWSRTFTTNGGSTTTLTLAASTNPIRSTVIGSTLEFLSGANIGVRTTVSDVIYSADLATVTIIVPTLANAVVSGVTFRMNSGRYFCWTGSNAASAFKALDVATATWSSNLSVTTLGATTTEASMTGAFLWGETYASGTATAATANTLSNSAKTWTTNQWANFQVRITAGTGIGQIRVISSNTGTQLTVATNWTTTPDTSSQYVIEGDEDKLYVIQTTNNTTLYRYSISADTWTVLSPTTARSGGISSGNGLMFIGDTGDTNYSTESVNLNGRYLYSPRGGGVSTIDRYDIAANTWQNAITFTPNNDTAWTTGSMWVADGRFLYGRTSSTGNRILRYDVTSMTQEPFTFILYPENTTNRGHRMMIKSLDSAGTVKWLYVTVNSSGFLTRIPIY